MKGATLAAVVAALAASANPSAQATGTDIQAWPSAAVTVSFAGRVEIRADGLLQLTDALSRTGLGLLRVVIVAKVNDRVALGGGYTWTRVEGRPGRHAVEHRALQQVDVRLPVSEGGCVVSSRTRLELRRQAIDAATSFRLREQVRLDVPVAGRGVTAVAWTEYFHSINGTGWSGESGPALVLTFVGVHLPVGRRTTIEPGYLNQSNFIGGNRARHVVAVFLGIRLSAS